MQRPEFRRAARESLALSEGQGSRFLQQLVAAPRGSAFHAEYALSQHRLPKGRRSVVATQEVCSTILRDERFPALPPELVVELFLSFSPGTSNERSQEFTDWVEGAVADLDAGAQQARLLALEHHVQSRPNRDELRWMSRVITTTALECCIDRGLVGWLHLWLENHVLFEAAEFGRWWTSAALNFSSEVLLDESLWILRSILKGRTDRDELLGTIPAAWDPTLEQIRARLCQQ